MGYDMVSYGFSIGALLDFVCRREEGEGRGAYLMTQGIISETQASTLVASWASERSLGSLGGLKVFQALRLGIQGLGIRAMKVSGYTLNTGRLMNPQAPGPNPTPCNTKPQCNRAPSVRALGACGRSALFMTALKPFIPKPRLIQALAKG